jgi:bla regulator protein blaR1
MTVPDLQSVAQIFTERLLNTAVEGVVIAGMVWLLLRIIGRHNSGTRFAIWLSALLAVAALPFISGLELGRPHGGALLPGNLPGEITLPGFLAFYLFAGWGVGAGLSLLGLGVGLWRVRQIRRQCCEVDLSILDPAIAGTLRDFNSRRSVKLCVSSDVTTPAAIGFFRPAIVFPAGLLSQLSADEIKVILLHELAHLRRWDDWTNLSQKLVKAVFFFHPAVWWIENRLTLEREMACDDVVLAQTASPRAYASSLISFAEKLRSVRGMALAQSLVSRMCQMSLRVANILDAKRPERKGLWAPVLGVSTCVLALVFAAAAYAPRVVAFQSHSDASQTLETQPVLQAAHHDVPAGVDAASSRSVAMNVAQPSKIAPRVKAISAAFHPRTVVAPLRLKEAQTRAPLVMRAQTAQEDLGMPETLVIVQTTRYDASGAGIWTLCVWKVGGENHAEKQWESAVILSVI